MKNLSCLSRAVLLLLFSLPLHAEDKAEGDPPIEPQMVAVCGQVSTPGIFEYKQRSTIWAIIHHKAGGPTVFGALSRVKVYRGGKQLLFNVKIDKTKKQEFAEPGDIIEVLLKSLER